MSKISPRPILARVAKTWTVPPGLKIALVEDVAQNVWIMETCPAGTQCWTVAQAAQLSMGSFSRHAWQEAVREGMKLEAARKQAAPVATASEIAPAIFAAQQRIAPTSSGAPALRRPTRKRIPCQGGRETPLARV